MKVAVLPFLLVIGCMSGQNAEPKLATVENADELIAEMRTDYDGDWYKTLTFVQHSITHRPDGRTDTSVWFEALKMPGKLRVDVTPLDNGNGFLFNSDTLYNMSGGSVARKNHQIHPLLTLGFDVYFDDPGATSAKLSGLGFDLATMREDTWQGRPVYVVGAAAGDTTSAQFWIDRENLYFVRSLQPAGPGGQVTQEIQFNKYEKLGGGWIAPEVLFFANGRLTFEELYSELSIGMPLSDSLFDASLWSTADHWH